MKSLHYIAMTLCARSAGVFKDWYLSQHLCVLFLRRPGDEWSRQGLDQALHKG